MKFNEAMKRARERRRDALRMRLSGLSFREIGERLGSDHDGSPISACRAIQLVRKAEREENIKRAKALGTWDLPPEKRVRA